MLAPYKAVRIAIWSIFIILVVLILIFRKKGKKLRNVLLCASFIIGLAFSIVASLLPVENLFVTFPSAQSALLYMGEGGEVRGQVNGENSTLGIYRTAYYSNLDGFRVLLRTEKGWKIKNPYTYDIIGKFGDGYNFFITRDERRRDYYVILNHSALDHEVEITDSANSDFFALETDSGGFWWYAYIESIDENYAVHFNGEAISLDILPIWLNSKYKNDRFYIEGVAYWGEFE